MKLKSRIAVLRSIIAADEISVVNGATPQIDEDGKVVEDIATCGNCGTSWNDALITGRTPAPSARCPYEQIHSEVAELRKLEQRASRRRITRRMPVRRAATQA
jgi:hypothetical protein